MQKAFFQTWKHLPFALGRLSKMCELATHCRSLPSEACSTLHSSQMLFRNRSLPLDPHSLSVPSTFKAFIYWVSLAWRTSNLSMYSLQYIFIVVRAYVCWRKLKMECMTERCPTDLQNEFCTSSFIKTAPSSKVKLLRLLLFCVLKTQRFDWVLVFHIDFKSWTPNVGVFFQEQGGQGGFIHCS